MMEVVNARVCVCVQYEIEYGRGVSLGIVAYARQKTNWRLWRQRELNVKEIVSTGTNGVITQYVTPQQKTALQEAGVAFVLVGQAEAQANLTAVTSDESTVA